MKRYLVILAVILNGIVATYGQNLDVFHFMRTSPFRNFDTPSCETIYNGYVSLPGGQVHVGGNLGSIRYNNLFATDNEGYPTTLTATRFANSLSKNNYVGAISSMELLGFGFRVKKKFFITMDYRLRFNADIRYSKALFGLPVYGNMAYVDDPADMNISANVSAYQEIGVSIRHKINDRMSWGVRPKVLFGMANLRADKVSALLTTDPVNYGLAMQYDALIKASAIMPYSLTFDKENGFSFDYSTKSSDIIDNLFKNPGVGIDLGFTFKPLPAFNVSFSVLDLGFINWKTNTTQMQSVLYDAGRFYEDGSLVFGGMTQDDIQYLIDGGKIGDYLDTLAYYFPLEVGPTKSYVTSWSNSLWRELQGTGVTVTALMPGAMKTGFADAGGLADTKLFANAVDPTKVAQAGYNGMLKGKLNVISGLPGWQTPMMKLAPLFPKKAMLNFVYDQQIAGSAKK